MSALHYRKGPAVRTVVRSAVVLSIGVLVGGATAVACVQGASANPHSPTRDGKRVTAAVPFQPAKADSVFVPITPCRIVDTRLGGGIVHASSVRSFHVRGSAGFSAQGGTSAGCGIPAAATSVVTSVTATGASGSGYLNGYPYGASAPTSNFAWFYKDRTSTTNPTLPLAASGAAFDLSVKASSAASTQVIIDVDGYYEQQIEAFVNGDATIFSSTTRVVGASTSGTGVYAVSTDTNVEACSATATADLPGVTAIAFTSGNHVDVRTYLGSALVNALFNLTVTC